jgi:hypothetical protein
MRTSRRGYPYALSVALVRSLGMAFIWIMAAITFRALFRPATTSAKDLTFGKCQLGML